MHEAVNYINHLQNKVNQSQTKRDELMKQSNLSTIRPENGSSTTNILPPYVVVHPLPGGIQIMCSCSFRIPLSRVLDILLKEGLNVVSSTSTKTNGSFIHTIRSEVPYCHFNCHEYDCSSVLKFNIILIFVCIIPALKDPNMTGTDFSGLQRKLTEAISSSSKTLL